MSKKQFTLDSWLKDKSQKVVTRCGFPVRIIAWDVDSNQPIVAALRFKDSFHEVIRVFTTDGRYSTDTDDESALDLFIETNEVSEDEIVIRALKSHLTYMEEKEGWKGVAGIKMDRILAWLEKQGKKRKITHEEICKSYGIPDIGEFSDGYHTFNGLYKQRMILFAVLVKTYKDRAWKSWKHEDGLDCFGGGWFIVGIDTPAGTYTYHYEAKDWDRFDCQILEKAKHWDGHDESDVERLFSLVSNANKDEVIKCLINGMKFYYEDNEEATWGTEKFSMKVKDILSCLEKQCEQKFEMKTAEESLGIDSDTYNKIVDECIFGEQNPADKIEPKFKVGDKIYLKPEYRMPDDDTPIANTVKEIRRVDDKHYRFDGAYIFIEDQDKYELVEQKPEENKGNIGGISANSAWSEEDEKNLRRAIRATKVVYPVAADWLESLKGRVHPKQEWSDVDKDILFRTINDLKFLRDTISIDPKYAVNIIDMEREITWLKSLRPQNRWKPSDEQISLLQAIINEPNNAASESCQIVLKDILEQLKKLKESKV